MPKAKSKSRPRSRSRSKPKSKSRRRQSSSARQSKKPRATKRAHKRRSTRRHVRRGGGPDDIFEFSDIAEMSVRELQSHLTQDDLREARRHGGDEAAQKRLLMTKVAARSRSNAALKKYRDDTPKYMVSEPGMMPYDSRLTDDTSVADNLPRPVEQIKPIRKFAPDADAPESERLKAAFQASWKGLKGDGPGIDTTNHIIRSSATSAMVSKPYAKRLRDEYDADFRVFIDTDPAYSASIVSHAAAVKERMSMGTADREAGVIEAPARRAASAAKVEAERQLVRSEEVRGKISWAGVKRRGISYGESDDTQGAYIAHIQLTAPPRTFRPYIRFASAAEVAEAMELRALYIPEAVRAEAAAAADANAACNVVFKYNRSVGKYDGHVDIDQSDRGIDTIDINDIPRGATKVESRRNPGKHYVNLPSGRQAWVVGTLYVPPPPVPDAPARTETSVRSNQKDRLRERFREKRRREAEASEKEP